jgi:glycolate oxidase iron-sulfur subunit
MLAASGTEVRKGGRAVRWKDGKTEGGQGGPEAPDNFPSFRPSVALFRGCVMHSLFAHVHGACRRTLEANGYRVVEVSGQACCGALHEHAGARTAARALIRTNAAAFAGRVDLVAVDSAGCGALLKDASHLDDSKEAMELAGKTRDISELLAERGPRPGAALELDIAYDAPCHLEHAQGVRDAPLALLRAVPGVRVRRLPGSDRCCGAAGIYALLHPEMARSVLDAKLRSIGEANPQPDLVATGNPGCLMQIGAGLRAVGLNIGVVHPVEVLDWSYAEAGLYG